MRVLIVHNFYQIPGGEDSVVREELSMLRARGIETDLFSTTNDEIKGRVKRISAGLQTVYSVRARRALSKKLREFQPTLVHIHNFFPLLSPSILDSCRSAGVPTIMTLHNFRILTPGASLNPGEATTGRGLRAPCWGAIPRKVYRNSAAATLALVMMIEFHKWVGTWKRKVDRFIVPTDWVKQMYTAGGLPAERISVKPNCFAQPQDFGGMQREGALFVGRLDQQKGIDILLCAWEKIGYPLRIIGDGPLLPLVLENGNPRITYLGRQPRDVVAREMQAARFLVLPSVGHETFSMTVIEAFANRLPVICSDQSSLTDRVQDGLTGLTFPTGDVAALRARVKWAAANPAALDEMGRSAHALYKEGFTPEVNFKELIAIYRSVSRDSRPSTNPTSFASSDLAPALKSSVASHTGCSIPSPTMDRRSR
jgi:glycosyltransferase involved in cell wall biosynthesis